MVGSDRLRRAYNHAGGNSERAENGMLRKSDGMVRSMIRSRILIGILSILFLMLSVRVTSKSCHAFEKEKAHENHYQFAQGLNGDHSSMPRIPLENPCSCSSSVSSCCMGTMKSTSKNSHTFLLSGNTLRQLSVLQAVVVNFSDYIPLNQRDRCFDDFNSFLQEESFLVNCTFLI